MQRIKPSGFSLLLLLVLLLGACGTQTHTAKRLALPTPTTTFTPTPTPDPTPAVGFPERLIISRIGVDAHVEDVGVASNGDLQTPQQSPWEDVGWYQNGPYPGMEGSSVINGHLDRPGGYPAVFWRLRELQPGDTVEVVDSLQHTWHFRVLRVASYPPQNAPLQQIFTTTGGIYLNLITCAGTWIPVQHQTTLRLVVYTVLTT